MEWLALLIIVVGVIYFSDWREAHVRQAVHRIRRLPGVVRVSGDMEGPIMTTRYISLRVTVHDERDTDVDRSFLAEGPTDVRMDVPLEDVLDSGGTVRALIGKKITELLARVPPDDGDGI